MKKKFARYKVYMDRGRQYSGYILFFMNTSVYLSIVPKGTLSDLMRNHPISTGLVAFLVVVFGHLLVGGIDYKHGLLTEEHRNYSETNPVTMDILNTMKSIEKELKELKCSRSILEEPSEI